MADVFSDFPPSGDTISSFSWQSFFVLQMTFPCLLQGEEIIGMGGAKTSPVEMRDEDWLVSQLFVLVVLPG